ncbi:MAG: A/G-specific adenine glycosylase [Rhodocyclaceae bacterium]|nr:A/G-specific adenine glycosylase [Rhodocyclaceae bacterium]
MPSFAHQLIRWQKSHGRHGLPWQGTDDPYRVWLSEIMLQQTQVATVIPYYERFLARFPALADLAASPVEDVMAIWSGLGYYARARNLHACARTVVEAHGGRFPQEAEIIARLPGIGRSTANAIAVFCFGAHAPILDGNVKRVLCRHAGIDGFSGTPAVESRLWRLAESLLPEAGVSTYIQAQMDLGATVCTRTRPRCESCPAAGDCIARIEGRIDELPAARRRKALPERTSTVLVLVCEGRVLLEPRPPAGIWGGLLSLPELPEGHDPAAHVDYAARLGCRIRSSRALPAVRHGFTHFRLTLSPLLCEAEALPRVSEQSQRWLDGGELARAPLPAPIRKILSGIP